MTTAVTAWPLDVTLHAATGRVELLWSDGVRASVGGQRLRQACRCAHCVSLRHAGQPVAAAADCAVSQLHPIGEMGLQLVFSDGHDRGIYPWPYLYELAVAP